MSTTQSLHDRIMNLPDGSDPAGDGDPFCRGHKHGHRDARHAAAELATEVDAELAALRAECERKTKALEFIATHDSSEWPERCRNNVQMARAVIAAQAQETVEPMRTTGFLQVVSFPDPNALQWDDAQAQETGK